MQSNSKKASTRRQLLIAAIAYLPVSAWAETGAPPALSVAPAGDGASVTSRARLALAELNVRLEEMLAAQAVSTQLLTDYGRLMKDEARNAAALEARIQEMDVAMRKLEAQAAKIEKIAQLIESLLPQILAMAGTDANAAAECQKTGARLAATGYIDAAQNAAIANGKFRWTVPDIRAAVVRGNAGLARFKRPQSTPPEKKKPVNAPGGLTPGTP